MSDSHAFSAITDFDGLRWWLPEIIVGDGPDARTCSFLFKSRIRHCHPSQGFIEFENRTIFYTYRRCLANGTPAYLFFPDNIANIYRRRQSEYIVEAWFESVSVGDVEDARALGELAREAAGSPGSLRWAPLGYIWSQVEPHLVNVGLPHLEQLVDLIASLRTAAKVPPTALAAVS